MNPKLENEERVENLQEIIIEVSTSTGRTTRVAFRLDYQNMPLFNTSVGPDQEVSVTLRFKNGKEYTASFVGGPTKVIGRVIDDGVIAVTSENATVEVLNEVLAISSEILLRDPKGSR